MPRRPIVRDPSDPEFPHGTTVGYRRGCTCATCRQVHSDYVGRSLHWRTRIGPTHIPSGPALAHLRLLLALPGVDGAAITRATNDAVGPKFAVNALRENRPTMHRDVAATVLAVTISAAVAQARVVPSTRARQRSGSLRALGWTLRAQAEQMDMDHVWLARALRGDTVTTRMDAAITTLAEQIGDQRGPSARAVASARAEGFYPPAAYDDDGVLVGLAVTDARPGRARRYDREQAAATDLRVLLLTVDGRSADVIAGRLDISERRVVRVRSAAGLVVTSDSGAPVALAPGQDALVRAVRLAHAAVDGGLAPADEVRDWLTVARAQTYMGVDKHLRRSVDARSEEIAADVVTQAA